MSERRSIAKATLAGLFPIVAWGISLPLIRELSQRAGLVFYVGLMYGIVGALTLASNVFRGITPIRRSILKNRLFQVRWLLFIIYFWCIASAVFLVQKPMLPIVILINYLWPTFLIAWSLIFKAVRIKHHLAYWSGSALIIIALAIEVLSPSGIAHLSVGPHDFAAFALALCSALMWSLYSVLSRRGGDKAGGIAVIWVFQLTLGLALPASLATGTAHWGNLVSPWLGILLCYCVTQFIALQCWDFGMRHGNVVMLSLCADFIPWLSLLSAHFISSIGISPATISSAVLLVIGAMITRYGTQQQADTFAELE